MHSCLPFKDEPTQVIDSIYNTLSAPFEQPQFSGSAMRVWMANLRDNIQLVANEIAVSGVQYSTLTGEQAIEHLPIP